MKVLLIDPWGINNTSEYLNGLIFGLSDIVDLEVVTNFYFTLQFESKSKILTRFFKRSEKMERSKLRTIVRGIEYFFTYRDIIRMVKKNNYDVIHINWLLNYKIDIMFLKKMKKYCNKIVYTAHNAIPHFEAEKKICELKNIYNLTNVIIVHGEAVKKELIDLFPETKTKIYVQKHGCVLREPNDISKNDIPVEICNKVRNFKKIFLCIGAIFPNKGVDRLARIWLDSFLGEDALLIVGGRQNVPYPEYEVLKPNISAARNMLLLDGFIDDTLLEYLFFSASIIVLPYKHASMSGVVFSAAQYNKTVMCTNVGALAEYLNPGVDSFLCDNSENGIKEELIKILSVDNKQLIDMGKQLHYNIKENCDWNNICAGIMKNVYDFTGYN